jgi:predicted DNA-binding transcriptional regulator AlpA
MIECGLIAHCFWSKYMHPFLVRLTKKIKELSKIPFVVSPPIFYRHTKYFCMQCIQRVLCMPCDTSINDVLSRGMSKYERKINNKEYKIMQNVYEQTITKLESQFQNKTLITINELADFLGMAKSAIYRQKDMGTLPAKPRKIGGKYFFNIFEIAEGITE